MSVVLLGGADGIRTHDLLDAIEARSQLRHGPTAKLFFSLPYPPRRATRPLAQIFLPLIFR